VQALWPMFVAFFFAIGTALFAIPVNYFDEKTPTGAALVNMSQYFQAKPARHFWGVQGGLIWCTETVFNFVASHAQMFGPTVSYAIGQGDDGCRLYGACSFGRNSPTLHRSRED
jgi:glucose uptake protein